MSGIAEVMLNLGFAVSGSDLADSAATQRLKALGAKVHIGHADANVNGAHAVVTSTAVTPDNPEVAAARARVSGSAARDDAGGTDAAQQGIAVAGTTARRRPPAWLQACSRRRTWIPPS